MSSAKPEIRINLQIFLYFSWMFTKLFVILHHSMAYVIILGWLID